MQGLFQHLALQAWFTVQYHDSVSMLDRELGKHEDVSLVKARPILYTRKRVRPALVLNPVAARSLHKQQPAGYCSDFRLCKVKPR